MDSRVETTALLVILTIAALTLGFTFDGVGFGSAPSSSSVKAIASATTSGSGPHFLVKAKAAELTSGAPNVSSGANPSYTYVPILGLRLVLVGTEIGTLTRLGRPLSYFVFTNSSGEGQMAVAPGNYTVYAAGANFNITKDLSFKGNMTTTLNLAVAPVYSKVVSLEVVNQDTSKGVEPTATIYAQVEGKGQYDTTSVYELTGFGQAFAATGGTNGILAISLYRYASVNATVTGAYPSLDGTWVVMSPAGYYPVIPVNDVLLLHYVVNATVNLTGP